MAGDRTTDTLLKSVRRRPLLPAVGSYADESLCELLNEELQDYILPLLMSVNGEYLVYPDTQSLVSGKASYPIHTRAVGGKIRDVKILRNGVYVSLQQTEPERAHQYALTGFPEAFYLEANNVVLVPTPDSALTDGLRMTYYRRPGELVLSSKAGKVTGTSVVGSNTLLTVSGATAASFSGKSVDLIQAVSPFGWKAVDVTAGLSGASVVIPTSTLTSDVVVGDFVCLADQSCIPQIPVELHTLLAQRTAAVTLAGLGNAQAPMAEARTEKMRQDVVRLLAPRSEGTGRVIINPNAPGYGLRTGFRR